MSKRNQNYTNRKQNRFQPERMRGNVFVNNSGKQWLPGENGKAAKVERLLRRLEKKEIASNMAGYKDSGVEWIGAIPKEWSVNRLKNLSAFKTGGTPPRNKGISSDNNGTPWVTPSDITDSLYVNNVEKYISDNAIKDCKYKLYPKNSILLVCIASVGKIALIDKEAYSNQQITALMTYRSYDARFILCALKAAMQKITSESLKTVVPIINTKALREIKIALPPLPEQQRIADFLDTKCGILDRTIDAVSRQIEDLEKYKRALITKTVTKGICKKGEPERAMKDSGVEWIGEDIPFDWDINRLQFCIDEISEKNYAGKETHILSLMKDKGVIPYEEKGRVGNISKTDLTQYKLAYQNTLITNSMNIIIGSSGISQYKGCVSPAYYVFKAKPNNDIRYFNYIFAVRAFQNECRRFANGILEIRLRISSTNLLKIKVPVPPLAEQQQIADYLDEKCKNIDNRVQKRRQQLEWLKEYKNSLIFDYVTGKKRVEK